MDKFKKLIVKGEIEMALEDLLSRSHGTIFKNQIIKLSKQFNFLLLRTSNKIFVDEVCRKEWDSIILKALSINYDLSKGFNRKKSPFHRLSSFVLVNKKTILIFAIIFLVFAVSINRFHVLTPINVNNSAKIRPHPKILVNKNYYQYKFTDNYGRVCEDGVLIVKGEPYKPHVNGVYYIPKSMITYGSSEGSFSIKNKPDVIYLTLSLEDNIVNHFKIDCPCKYN